MLERSASLNRRLLISASLVLAVFLWLVFFALEKAFVSSVTRAESEKLQSTIMLLLAEAESDQQGLKLSDTLQEARFNQFDSGLYGFIFDEQGVEIWRSASAMTLSVLPREPSFSKVTVGVNKFGTLELDRSSFLFAAMGIEWQHDSGAISRHTFSVLESADYFTNELQRFRKILLARLLLVGFGLLIVQLIVLHWGLMPIRQLGKQLKQVEKGELATLEGRYPVEIESLAANLNKLLEHEQWQRERYKNTLSDLAHSLKTPLSIAVGVLSNRNTTEKIPSKQALNGADDNTIVSDQLQRMNEIVQYQLQRAVSAHAGVSVGQLAISPVVQRLLDTMEKVYADKKVIVAATSDDSCYCKIDERDLMELLGNLIDNAFKYCKARVSVNLYHEGAGVSVFEIADDGPGVVPALRESIFSRGQRLDTRTAGQGIGLTVAMEIAQSYQATLEVGDSTLGGALFTLRLPMSALSIR